MRFAQVKRLMRLRESFEDKKKELFMANEEIEAIYKKLRNSLNIYDSWHVLSPETGNTEITVRQFVEVQRKNINNGRYDFVAENYEKIMLDLLNKLAIDGTRLFDDEMRKMIELLRRQENYISLSNKIIDEVVSVTDDETKELEERLRQLSSERNAARKDLQNYESFLASSSDNLELLQERLRIVNHEVQSMQEAVERINRTKQKLFPSMLQDETVGKIIEKEAKPIVVQKPVEKKMGKVEVVEQVEQPPQIQRYSTPYRSREPREEMDWAASDREETEE